MSKKTMLLALVVASAAMFALPPAASAQEIHFESESNQSFMIAGGAVELRTPKEQTITCQSTDGTGAQTNSTTGTLTLDLTGCHINVLGITVKCRSAGSPLDNTVASGWGYHLTTIGEKVPAILVTANTTAVVCAGVTVRVTGNLIGTITSPKCNETDKILGLSFTAAGTTQDHAIYTGSSYNLTASTTADHSDEVPAAFVGGITASASNLSLLNCT